LLTYQIAEGRIIEGMRVIGVHKPGSPAWNNAIRTEALKTKKTQDEIRAFVGNRDFVQTRKMGFLFAVNIHGGLYAEGLEVGDVIDVRANGMHSEVVRVVKRANKSK